MQGRWVDINEPSSSIIVQGGEVICFGHSIDYDYKLVSTEDGAISVSLEVDDEAAEDDFQRANITGLVITPEGEFHAYNTKFGCQFVRA